MDELGDSMYVCDTQFVSSAVATQTRLHSRQMQLITLADTTF